MARHRSYSITFKRQVVHPHCFASLRLVPSFVFDDAQMRNFFRLPLVLWIWPGDTLASIGVLHHSDLVPDDPTDIELVEEQTYAALCISVDGGTVPPYPPRWRYPIPVEVTG